MLNIHASCVAWQNQGILIFGPSGQAATGQFLEKYQKLYFS